MPYIQLKAGHSQSAITERYIHAAQVLFPDAAAKGEARLFANTLLVSENGAPASDADPAPSEHRPAS